MCSECQPVLSEFDRWIDQITNQMGSEYARIRARATEDPGTAGDEGEEGWAGVLRDWLPSTYEIRTKGRILAHDGGASRQVDLVVLRPGYPRRLLESKMYMASGVAAAFECKLTLKANHLAEAVETGAQIARLCAPRSGTPYRELVSPIIYGVLAHSHCWSNEGAASQKVNEAMAAGRFQVGHAREELDVVCIANACTYLKSVRAVRQDGIGERGDGKVSTFTGAYVAYAPPAPIGPLIAYVLMRLAWEDPSVRPFAEYFRLSNMLRQLSGGDGARPDDGLTSDTRTELLHRLRNRPLIEQLGPRRFTGGPKDWDEWDFILE